MLHRPALSVYYPPSAMNEVKKTVYWSESFKNVVAGLFCTHDFDNSRGCKHCEHMPLVWDDTSKGVYVDAGRTWVLSPWQAVATGLLILRGALRVAYDRWRNKSGTF